MNNQALKTTLKLQPVVVLFSCASICSKLASKQLPVEASSFSDFVLQCMRNWKLIFLLGVMIFLLGIYAYIWQRIIRNSKIAIVYANKSSYLFWTQLAAIIIFGEHLSVCNIIGIAIIFAGVILGNSEVAK
jgi:drug/metabolite transporter (DMT)-like permease